MEKVKQTVHKENERKKRWWNTGAWEKERLKDKVSAQEQEPQHPSVGECFKLTAIHRNLNWGVNGKLKGTEDPSQLPPSTFHICLFNSIKRRESMTPMMAQAGGRQGDCFSPQKQLQVKYSSADCRIPLWKPFWNDIYIASWTWLFLIHLWGSSLKCG